MARFVFFSLSLVLVALDRLLKAWAASALDLSVPVPVLGQVVRLNRIHNVGGAFGIFPRSGILFIAVSSVVSAGLVVFLGFAHPRSALLKTGLSLVLAGAIGNLIDRLTLGYVLDFAEFRGLFIFNLADACITIGIALVLIQVFLRGDRDRPIGEAPRP
jgi:signal peptidase II